MSGERQRLNKERKDKLMRRFLTRATVTGADDSVRADDLLSIAERYPFVEYGILLSNKAKGVHCSPRFPSVRWINVTLPKLSERGVKLSGHICGRWVRDILQGDWSIIRELPEQWYRFGRFQINTYAQHFGFRPNLNWPLYPGGREIIWQMDGVNEYLLTDSLARAYKTSGLWDLSHGTGVLPDSWPKSAGIYCMYMGYAGGLGPENVADQLREIENVAGDTAWIDAETKLRSDNDMVFDFRKVEAFLEAASPWVI